MASPPFSPLLITISCFLLAGSPLGACASAVSCPSSCLQNLRRCPEDDAVRCRDKITTHCLAMCGRNRTDVEDDTNPRGLQRTENNTRNDANINSTRRKGKHQHPHHSNKRLLSSNSPTLKRDNAHKPSPKTQRNKRHAGYPLRNPQGQGKTLSQIEHDLIQYLSEQLVTDDREMMSSLKRGLQKRQESRSGVDAQQPIRIVERGSWNKRQPIAAERRGSWNKRQPIEIAERGSWNKRQPIEIAERGSWNKRFPGDAVDNDDDDWSRFQPIRISERGSWNKRFLDGDDIDDWSKFQPIKVQERGSWNKRGSWN